MKMIPRYEVNITRHKSPIEAASQFLSSKDAADFFAELLSDKDREHFIVLALDQRNKPIGFHICHIGTLTGADVHPREVFKTLILLNAAYFVVAHNHPSGNINPSKPDKDITERLKEAGTLLGIKLIDHIIIGDNVYFSFQDNGIL